MTSFLSARDYINSAAVTFETEGDALTAPLISDWLIPTAILLSRPETLADFAAKYTNFIKSSCGYSTGAMWSESAVRQLSKAQDAAFTGSMELGGVEFVTGMVCDGHGDDSCIKAIRAQDMSAILAKEINPIMALHDIMQAKGRAVNLHSGSTAAYARMGPTSVDTASCGDSAIYVYVNGVCVYKNKKHTWDNESERERLSGLAMGRPDQYIKLVDENTLTQAQDGWRVRFFMHGLALEPTQTLGHQNATGIAPEYGYVPFRAGDLVRVVLCSDGVSDMLFEEGFDDNVALMTLSAERLAQYAENKWRQEWTIESNGRRFPKQRIMADQFDDVSVVVLQNYQG